MQIDEAPIVHTKELSIDEIVANKTVSNALIFIVFLFTDHNEFIQHFHTHT